MATSTAIRNDLNLRSRDHAVATGDHGSAAPVLDGRNAAAARLARLTGRVHPVRTFLILVPLSYAAVAGLSTLLGLVVTRVLIANGTVAGDDGGFVRVLSHHRSGDLTEASLTGSIIAGGVVLPILVGAFGLVAALFRQWRLAAFLICALLIESAAYRTTTLLIHRHRPNVVRLENLPVNASYPSGHTAASIAVYGGLALLVSSRIASRWARVAIWGVAAAIPIYVALSRMYRGMHHPLDVVGGAAVGVATLVAVVLICRAAGYAVATREGRRHPDRGRAA
jgi:membrane-associated phospholipid phosphatase